MRLLAVRTNYLVGSGKFHGSLDDIQNFRVSQTVINKTSIPFSFQDTGIAQCHQVLGEISLPQSQLRLKVTNAGISSTDFLNDLQAGGMADQPEEFTGFSKWITF